MNQKTSIIQTLSEDKGVFVTPYINVDIDKVRFPNGVEGEYVVISNTQPKGAVILPLAVRRGIGYIGLVKQYRYPVKEFTLEFPRGGADDLEADGAEIEIFEEIGQCAKRLVQIGSIYPDTGILATEVGVWIAVMDSSVLDENHEEDITGLRPYWIQEGEFEGKVINGTFRCGISLTAYALFKIRRNEFRSLLDS